MHTKNTIHQVKSAFAKSIFYLFFPQIAQMAADEYSALKDLRLSAKSAGKEKITS